MKKIIMVLLLAAATTALKAQQTVQVKPDVKLNNGLDNYFKPDTYPTPQALITKPKDELLNGVNLNTNGPIANMVYSTMPTIKGQNTDHMPVFASGTPGIKYTMLIKKVNIIDPTNAVQKQLP